MYSVVWKFFVVQLSGFDPEENKPKHGGVAQLGEHLPCKQGVKGSIPFISTIFQGRTASGSGLKNSVDEGREKPNNSTLSS